MTQAHLVLADGAILTGESIGADGHTTGEVVFNTSMTGYQQILTDPSYAGQLVVMTFPHIGNYGTSAADWESRSVQPAGLVVREAGLRPSHYRNEESLPDFLTRTGVVAMTGIDTRALTRRIRTAGVIMGTITTDETPPEALERLRGEPVYDDTDFVLRVTTREPYRWPESGNGPRIVVMDGGVKFNIMRELSARGCEVVVVPATTNAEDVLAWDPRGVVFSPGPGDPVHQSGMVRAARLLVERLPVLGICLGHQVIARAFGASTFKLKFGHRGGNHPVHDLQTGRVRITSQNHGYAVDPDGLRDGMQVSRVNLHDGTVEGLWHPELRLRTVQYHPEAAPGPWDNREIFDEFAELVRGAAS